MVKEVSEEETVRASWEGSSHLGLLQQLRVNTGSPDPVPTKALPKTKVLKSREDVSSPNPYWELVLGEGPES